MGTQKEAFISWWDQNQDEFKDEYAKEDGKGNLTIRSSWLNKKWKALNLYEKEPYMLAGAEKKSKALGIPAEVFMAAYGYGKLYSGQKAQKYKFNKTELNQYKVRKYIWSGS